MSLLQPGSERENSELSTVGAVVMDRSGKGLGRFWVADRGKRGGKVIKGPSFP